MFTAAAPTEVAPGLYRIKTAYVNAYLMGEPGGPWVLLDTGISPFSLNQAQKNPAFLPGFFNINKCC